MLETLDELAIRSVHVRGQKELRMAGAIIRMLRDSDDGLVGGAIGIKLSAAFGQSYRLLGCHNNPFTLVQSATLMPNHLALPACC